MPRMPRRPWPCDWLPARCSAAGCPERGASCGSSGSTHAVASGATAGASRTSTASNDADAWFGLGFCHAQDRAFQLELVLVPGGGRCPSWSALARCPLDRLSRTLGFVRMARAQLALLDHDVRDRADGVRRRHQPGPRRRSAPARAGPAPHATHALESRDVLAFAGLQALPCRANWDMELGGCKILLEDGPDALRAAGPAYPAWLPTHVPVATARRTRRWTGWRMISAACARRRAVAGRIQQVGPAPARGPPAACRCSPTTRISPRDAGAVVPRPTALPRVGGGRRIVRRRAGVPERPQRPRRVGHHRRHDRSADLFSGVGRHCASVREGADRRCRADRCGSPSDLGAGRRDESSRRRA